MAINLKDLEEKLNVPLHEKELTIISNIEKEIDQEILCKYDGNAILFVSLSSDSINNIRYFFINIA